MMIAARHFSGVRRARLPYDAEISYLQGDATAWIDTGIDLSGRTVSEIPFEMSADLSVDTSAGLVNITNGVLSVFGTASTKNLGIIAMKTDAREGFFFYAQTTTYDRQTIGTLDGDMVYRVSLKLWEESDRIQGRKVIQDADGNSLFDVTITTQISTNRFPDGAHVPIFARQNVVSNSLSLVTGRGAALRLRSFRFTSDFGSVDMIAVRKDGVGYLYDRVSGRLFGNAAETGAFIIGPDL